MLGVNGIHCGEVVEILEKNGGFDDLREAAAAGFENRFQVGEDLSGLLGNAVGYDLLGLGVERNLAGGEEQAAGANKGRWRAALRWWR